VLQPEETWGIGSATLAIAHLLFRHCQFRLPELDFSRHRLMVLNAILLKARRQKWCRSYLLLHEPSSWVMNVTLHLEPHQLGGGLQGNNPISASNSHQYHGHEQIETWRLELLSTLSNALLQVAWFWKTPLNLPNNRERRLKPAFPRWRWTMLKKHFSSLPLLE
jgi:hypothetical protein